MSHLYNLLSRRINLIRRLYNSLTSLLAKRDRLPRIKRRKESAHMFQNRLLLLNRRRKGVANTCMHEGPPANKLLQQRCPENLFSLECQLHEAKISRKCGKRSPYHLQLLNPSFRGVKWFQVRMRIFQRSLHRRKK